ncbi:MAG TPA: ABC transporter ATP-binding protein [Bacteroidetes bacterium]|nr:ABC transporter ATP-binding protein [Bacteroidota bacterium]
MDFAIETKNLRKRYGPKEALRGIDLEVRPREIFGLIGPDGAGKTTLMRVLCTLVPPDEGEVRVLGLDIREGLTEIRSRIGYMPQQFSLYQDLSVQQNLEFFADLFQVPRKEREKRLQELYRFSRLGPFKTRKAGNLSGGMKQKLALSCALIHTPELLILDEPTYGVDPVSRQEFWRLLQTIREQGATVFVSTAYMDETDQCDRAAFIYGGKIRALGSPSELKAMYRHPLYRVWGRNLAALRDYFASRRDIRSIQLFGDALHVGFLREPSEKAWVLWKKELGADLEGWEKTSPSVEDVFMDLISEPELD